MGRFTRGFTGRGKARATPGSRPASTTPATQWPVLTAEVTPKLDTATWTFTVDGLVERPTTWTWDEIHALPPSTYDGDIHCVTTWSKFGMTFTGVSVDTLLEAAGPLPTATHVLALCHTGYTTNLPLADVTGGKAWVVWEVDGEPLARRARRPGPAARAAPLLLEEREVGRPGLRAARPRRARLLGAQRLPRPRRPLARAALPGRLSREHATVGRTPWQTRHGRRDPRRDRRRAKTFRLALAEPVAPSRRASTTSCASPRPTATPRRARTRSRRRPTARTRSSSPSSGSTDGEVSTFLHDVVVGRRRARGARPDRRLVRVGRRHAGAARRRRLGRRAADGDAAPRAPHRPRPTWCELVVSVRTPDDLYYARRAARARDHGRLHARRAGRRRRARPDGSRPPTSPTLIAPDATAYVCGSPPLRRRRQPTCSSTSACPSSASASSASARAAKALSNGRDQVSYPGFGPLDAERRS